MIRPSLLAVARGDETPDLILANARLVNIFNGEVEPGSDIAIHADRLAGIRHGHRSGAHPIDMSGSVAARPAVANPPQSARPGSLT